MKTGIIQDMDTLPPNAEATFWTSIGKVIPKDAKVYVSSKAESPKDFLDAMERTPEAIPSAEQAYVIFVDLYPEANWAHECLFVYVVSDGSLFAVKHDWPPNEKHEMIPMERPKE